MKKNILLGILTMLIMVGFINCWQAMQSKSRAGLLRLKLGMTKEEVLRIMKKPVLNEAYKTEKGTELVILFFYTNRMWADGNTTRDECTPVVLEDGKVIGWGNEFYRLKVEVIIKKVARKSEITVPRRNDKEMVLRLS